MAILIEVSGGCTVAELISITIHDVDIGENKIFIRLSKGQKKIVIKNPYMEKIIIFMKSRPRNTDVDNLFLRVDIGDITTKKIEEKYMAQGPFIIALYLDLNSAYMFKHHSFKATHKVLKEIPSLENPFIF